MEIEEGLQSKMGRTVFLWCLLSLMNWLMWLFEDTVDSWTLLKDVYINANCYWRLMSNYFKKEREKENNIVLSFWRSLPECFLYVRQKILCACVWPKTEKWKEKPLESNILANVIHILNILKIFLICLFCWKQKEIRREDIKNWLGLHYCLKLTVLNIMACVSSVFRWND